MITMLSTTHLLFVCCIFAFKIVFAIEIEEQTRDRRQLGACGHATTVASGKSAIALGCGPHATGAYSVAIGRNTTAQGLWSLAMGLVSTASGESSVAIGRRTVAQGFSCTALGVECVCSGDYSATLGADNHASGKYSLATGHRTTAKGEASTTLGFGTSAGDYETVVGRYNMESNTSLFTVGNGLNHTIRSNVFSITKDGDTIVTGRLVVEDQDVLQKFEDIADMHKNSTEELTNVLANVVMASEITTTKTTMKIEILDNKTNEIIQDLATLREITNFSNSIETSFKNINTTVTELQQGVRDIRKDIGETESDLKALKETDEDMLRELKDIRDDVIDLQNMDLSSTKQEILDAMLQFENNTEEIDMLKANNTALQLRLDDTNKEIAALKAMIEGLQKPCVCEEKHGCRP
eukprot:m.113829 g.113829  ORF g.113829 m.113829 type:complete len:409 (-) comp14149_c0_seq2:121-1347(-)